MTFSATVEISALKKALALASKAFEKGKPPSIPILNCFMFDVVGECIFVTATDLDIEMTATVPASGLSPGRVCVHKSIRKMIDTTSGNFVSLTEVAGRLLVDMADGRASFLTIPASSFPDVLDTKGGKKISIQPEATLSAFKRLAPFISNEETRYYLNGICIRPDSDKTVFAATNGHILGKIVAPKQDISLAEPNVIIPSKAVEIIRGLNIDDVSLFGKTARFMLKGIFRLQTRMIDGTFPDYDRVIPDDSAPTIMIDPAKWLPKLRRLGAMGRSCNIQFGSRCSASIRDDDMNLVLALEGSGSLARFQGQTSYFIAALAAHNGEVFAQVGSQASPTKFTSENVTTVIMPWRYDREPIELPEGVLP